MSVIPLVRAAAEFAPVAICGGLAGLVLLASRRSFAGATGATVPAPAWGILDMVMVFVCQLGAALVLFPLAGLLVKEGVVSEVVQVVIAGGGSSLVGLGLVLSVVTRVHRQPLATLGWVPSPAWNLASTVALHVCLFPALIALQIVATLLIASILGSLPEEQAAVDQLRGALRDGERADFYWLAGSAVLLAPICEEVYFRGFVFGGLRSRIGLWPATLVAAVLFALVHDSLAVQLPIFALAITLTLVYVRTGSLVWPIVLHVLFNGTQITLLAIQP